MKTVTVKFDIENRADEIEVKRFLSTNELVFAVGNFFTEMRKLLKYDSERSEEFLSGIEHARDLMMNELHDYGLNLDQLSE